MSETYSNTTRHLLFSARIAGTGGGRLRRFLLSDGFLEGLPPIKGSVTAIRRLLEQVCDGFADAGVEGIVAVWEREGKLGICVYESGFWRSDSVESNPASAWLPSAGAVEAAADAELTIEARIGESGGCRLAIWSDLDLSVGREAALTAEATKADEDLVWALESMAWRCPPLTLEEALNASVSKEVDLAGAMVSALDNLPLAVAVFGTDGKPVYMNGAGRTLLGFESSGARIDCDELVARARVTGESYCPSGREGILQVKIQKEDRFFQPYVTPLLTQNGENTGVLLALNDISDQKLIADLRSDFVGSVSHEIKGPLTSIRMAIMLLLDDTIGELNAQQLDLAETAKEETERLLRSLNNLLDVQWLNSGQHRLDRSRHKAGDLLVASALEMKRVAKARDVELSVENTDTMETVVDVDRGRLVHVLNILVSNAIKHSEPGSKVQLAAVDGGLSTVRFTVRDSGRGIDPKYHQQIFNSYVKMPGEESPGVGLGLSLARNFVQSHGGHIGVDSDVGKGSVFYFEIERAS